MLDFLITLAVLAASAVAAMRCIARFQSDERPLLWLSFVAHQVAGAANILVTQYYYGYGDMLSFRNFGVVAAERLRADFWELAPGLMDLLLHREAPLAVPLPFDQLTGNSGAMQAVSSFAMFAFFDSLTATVAFIACIAFLTKVLLYVIARNELPHVPRRRLLVTCTLLPSALFWSTSLLKEPIALIGLLLALYSLYCWLNGNRRVLAVVLFVVGTAVVLSIKAYGYPAFVLAGGAWYFVRQLHARRGDVTFSVTQLVVAGIAATIVVFGAGMLAPEVAIDSINDQLESLQTSGQLQGEGQVGNSNYMLGAVGSGTRAQLALAPLGLLTALFRPLLFEAKSLIVLICALEMTLFVGAALVVIFRHGVREPLSELVRHPFLAFCAVFVMIFGTFVGLGTTNLGTLSRYRMPLTPFFATMLLALLVPRRSTVPRPSTRDVAATATENGPTVENA